jgi:hypothetical protein
MLGLQDIGTLPFIQNAADKLQIGTLSFHLLVQSMKSLAAVVEGEMLGIRVRQG